ncbi:hypothetical protein MMB232_02521 [Brevundimonas subvibrioides]
MRIFIAMLMTFAVIAAATALSLAWGGVLYLNQQRVRRAPSGSTTKA